MDSQEPGDRPARQPLRVDDGASGGRWLDQRESSPAGQSRKARPLERFLLPSQPRSASPESIFICGGWCDLDDNPSPTVVSLTGFMCLVSEWRSHGHR